MSRFVNVVVKSVFLTDILLADTDLVVQAFSAYVYASQSVYTLKKYITAVNCC